MRTKSSFQGFVFLMVVMFFCMTSFSFAQRGHRIQNNAKSILQARMDAQQDAQAETNPFLWGLALVY